MTNGGPAQVSCTGPPFRVSASVLVGLARAAAAGTAVAAALTATRTAAAAEPLAALGEPLRLRSRQLHRVAGRLGAAGQLGDQLVTRTGANRLGLDAGGLGHPDH